MKALQSIAPAAGRLAQAGAAARLALVVLNRIVDVAKRHFYRRLART